jgi:hypothetical protein
VTAPQIVGDYASLERELDRLSSLPGHDGVAHLDKQLSVVFAETEALVHVITGALRASGKTESKHEDEQWSGQMTFGGPAPGFFPRARKGTRRRVEKHPAEDARSRQEVVYAWYEMRRGGEHDYFREHGHYDTQFESAVIDVLKGEV